LILYLWPKLLKNNTLWGRTYLYSPYKGVPPPVIRPLLVLSARSKKKSEQEQWYWLCLLLFLTVIITAENNIRHNQNHGSRLTKYFFLISGRIILENYGSRLLMKSQFTRKGNKPFRISRGKKLGHSRITKIPFTTLMNGTVILKLVLYTSWSKRISLDWFVSCIYCMEEWIIKMFNLTDFLV